MSFYKSIPPLISVLYVKGYHDFPLINFCLTVPKNFVEDLFCVSENFCYRKMLGIRDRGGGYQDFPSKTFCLTVPKNFVAEPFCVSQNFCYRKNLWIRGGREYHNFLSKIFCLTVPKIFVGEPFCVSLISVIEKFYASEVYVTIFCRNFLSHSAEKFRRGTRLCCVSDSFR